MKLTEKEFKKLISLSDEQLDEKTKLLGTQLIKVHDVIQVIQTIKILRMIENAVDVVGSDKEKIKNFLLENYKEDIPDYLIDTYFKANGL